MITAPELQWRLCLSPGLAQNKYLENEAFLQFLSYLKYWKRKEYSRYILWVNRFDSLGSASRLLNIVCLYRYPHALAVLDLLEEELFRKVRCTWCSTGL